MNYFEMNPTEYCKFEEGKCYMLMLLPRKKENVRNSEKEKLGLCQRKIVRSAEDVKEALEYFEDFSSRYPKIVFRVYLSVEQRDMAKALFLMQAEINDMVKELYFGNKQVFDRTVNLSSTLKTILCRPATRAEKLFHFDVDWSNKTIDGQNKFKELVAIVKDCAKVLYTGRTLNGFTIVSECFNPNDLKAYYPEYKPKGMVIVPEYAEIKSNGMLYVGVFNYNR